MKFPVGDFKNGTEIEGVELVIMRPRRVFTSFEKTTEGNISLFTNEHNSWEDHLTLFEFRLNKRIKVVGSGTIESLRDEFPSLRINSNLYCLYDNEVYKLVAKGKTRQSLIDKQKELAKDGFDFFEKKIKLIPTQETGTGGNIYYFLNYEVVGDSVLDEVGPHMEEINKIMNKIDEEYAETSKRMTQETKDSTENDVEDDDILVEDTIGKESEDKEDDVIKPSEIPF